MDFQKKNLSKKLLLELYTELVKPRLIEERMIKLLRQGKVSKWFSGIGQEAISIGATLALKPDEYIFPLHRNLGVFTSRNVPLNRLFSQFQGKKSGFTKGRDRSFHFGTKEHHILGMISHLGPQLTVANGIGLGHVLKKENKVALAFTGEGATSEGDFHEALNVASVWNLPVIFVIENNGYSISTPVQEQYKIKSFTEKADAYAIETLKIDGNNVLEVYQTINRLAKSIRKKPRPVLIEAVTFRMRGHEESAQNDFVKEETLEEWAKKDPILNYEQFLKSEGILDFEKINEIQLEIQDEIERSLNISFDEDEINNPNTESELQDIFSPTDYPVQYPGSDKKHLRYVDALNSSLRESLEKYPDSILMGLDVAEFGGVFKVTEGLLEKFGKDRIRNTPLCESAILGMSVGLSVHGYKSVIEMQFGDFVSCGFNQIVNNIAKSHYRWGQNVDLVVRMPCGAGVGAGPFHSQTNEAWFFHTPGLKVIYPSSPSDAKGLLNAAIQDPNPCLFFEHKALYRSQSEEVANDYYTVEIGKGKLVSQGDDLTIVTYGQTVHWAKEYVDENNLDVEIIDLRTLVPWDKEMVRNSISKNGRVLFLSEDNQQGSIMNDLAAWTSEHLFEYLDAPLKVVGSLNTPVPFAKSLEDNYLPKKRMEEAIEALLNY